jgi:uncharacterized protein YukE
MSLLPDPGELRAVAARIDQHARAARARASRLGTDVASTEWQGRAARAFRAQADVALWGLRGAAGRLDDAADALRRHAEQVDDVLAALQGIVRAGLATVEELLTLPGDALRGLAGGVRDGVGGLAAAGGSLVSAAGGSLVSAAGDLADGALDAIGL